MQGWEPDTMVITEGGSSERFGAWPPSFSVCAPDRYAPWPAEKHASFIHASDFTQSSTHTKYTLIVSFLFFLHLFSVYVSTL